ncbi:MAG: SAM hydroxide adenosyltransferase [Opitutaceae bacterium]
MVSGEIEGAKFTLAIPDPWNRNVLFLAHGYRPPTAALSADVPLEDPACARLISGGWMIAVTSYRRNGMIVRDAIADINALRAHIESTESPPGLVILLGESMGGAIVTLIAENGPGRFHGAVAVGASLDVREESGPVMFDHAPQIPLLFLSNQSESAGPENYVAAAVSAPVPPAHWIVARDGHVNVNAAERSVAIDGLITWITTGEIERSRDATVATSAGSPAVSFSGNAAHGAVQSITETYGNIFTSFRTEDLAAIGLKRGDDFDLEAGGKTFRVRYGSDYGDVPHGAWIAFERAEGVILIARNSENAAATAGVSHGEALTIRPLSPHSGPE